MFTFYTIHDIYDNHLYDTLDKDRKRKRCAANPEFQTPKNSPHLMEKMAQWCHFQSR